MVVDWISFHHLTGDPFNTLPLQSDQDFREHFVQTADVAELIDPVWKHFTESSPRIAVIAGPRGVGKSTALHYIYNKVAEHGEVLHAYVPLLISAKQIRDPEYGIGYDFLRSVMSSLLVSLRSNLAMTKLGDSRSLYQERIQRIARAVGVELGLSEEVELVAAKVSTYGALKQELMELCRIMGERHLRVLISIDNFDKQPGDLAMAFLKKSYSQPVFEALVKSGATIIFTVSDEWVKVMKADPDFSYLGKPLILSPFRPADCYDMILKRLETKMEIRVPQRRGEAEATEQRFDASEIFEKNAVSYLCTAKKGNPRQVLEMARECLIRSSHEGLSVVTEDVARSVIKEEQESYQDFYSMIEKHGKVRSGFELLLELQGEREYSDFKNVIGIVLRIFKHSKVQSREFKIVRDLGLAFLVPVGRNANSIELNSHIKALLEFLERNDELDRFVTWVTRERSVSSIIHSPEELKSKSQLIDAFSTLNQKQKDARVRVLLREAEDAYNALDLDIREEDYDVSQEFSRLYLILANTVRIALLSESPSTAAVPGQGEGDLRLFMERRFPERAAEWSSEIAYCEVASHVPGTNPVQVGAHRSKAEKLALLVLRYAEQKLLESQMARPNEYKLGSIEELSNRLVSYLGQNLMDYFIATIEGLTLDDYILLGWTEYPSIYAYRCGRKIVSIDNLAPRYAPDARNLVLPKAVKEKLTQFVYRYSLKFYNNLELGYYLAHIAARHPVTVEFHTKLEVAVMRLRNELGKLHYSMTFQKHASG